MSIVFFEKDGVVGVVTLAKPPPNLIDDIFTQEMRQRRALLSRRSLRGESDET